MRRTMLLALAAALCAALAALAAAAPGSQASPAKPLQNSVTLQDSKGEDALGPDIDTIVVSNDDKGNLTFVINIPNRATFTGDMIIDILFDSDSNPATGDPNGADYAIELNALGGPAGVGLFRWDGTTFSAAGVSQTSLIFSYANGPTIKISAAELGGTKRFNFVVLATSGVVLDPATGEPSFANAHNDLAPDPGHGLYSYDVKIIPPTLVVRSSGTKPLAPRPDRPFTAFLVAARSDTGALVQSGKVTCKATIAFKPIKASSSGVANGRASCTWLIPKTAKGKKIRGSVTLEAEGLKATRSFTAKIG